ncbi:MAG: efflux RND transporter periplasmic adaptor subunit [Nitrospirae bacterium]|nr:MAG: efflux RND transporter periplasmic adaptor subunit [Nitrospirota bacterium]
MTTKTRWLMIVSVLGALGVIAFLLFRASFDQGVEQHAQTRVFTVHRTTVETRVSETGTLEPQQIVEIKSQFSGELARLFVDEGQKVAEGQLLAEIRQESGQARQVAQLRASIEEERLAVEQARRDLIRQQDLFEKGFASRKELEDAQQAHQRALVRLSLAERQLLLALGGDQDLYRRYLQRRLANDHLEVFQIRSPARGTILEVLVQPGEMITSGTATVGGGTVLMRVADLSNMVVKAKINEVDIARVRVGQPVEIRLDAIPDQRFEGKVSAIATQGEKEDDIVRYDVTITIREPDPRLRPMLTANVDIVTEALHNVLTVPLEALATRNGNDVVKVMVDGRIVDRPVRVALRTESEAVIVKGLDEGEQVLLPSSTAVTALSGRRQSR